MKRIISWIKKQINEWKWRRDLQRKFDEIFEENSKLYDENWELSAKNDKLENDKLELEVELMECEGRKDRLEWLFDDIEYWCMTATSPEGKDIALEEILKIITQDRAVQQEIKKIDNV